MIVLPAPAGFSKAVTALAAQLPATLSLFDAVIDFDEVPWSEVIHGTRGDGRPRLAGRAAEPMRQELAGGGFARCMATGSG